VKITLLLLLRYLYHYNLGKVTARLCITAAHCRVYELLKWPSYIDIHTK